MCFSNFSKSSKVEKNSGFDYHKLNIYQTFLFLTFAPLMTRFTNIIKYFLPVILMLAGGVLYGQQEKKKTKVFVEHADIQSYDEKRGKDIERLIGHVKMRHENTIFYCDSALLNSKSRNFDAFGNVHIIVNDTLDLYSDSLYYKGKTKMAELFGNVKLIDKNTVLTTDHLLFDRKINTGYYYNNGKIINKQNTLTSKEGYYNTDSRTFYFKTDVVLVNPDQETYSDTLIYNTVSETAFFKGPTIIKGSEGTIYCEDGWYDTKNDLSKLVKNPTISQNDQFLSSDSIMFDNAKNIGHAYGQVQILDTTKRVLIKGTIGEMWKTRGMAYVTDSATAITYDKNGDSLYISADTLWLFFDKNQQTKKILAYYNVRFFKKDLQGKCDSLSYSMEDSTIRLYYEPVLWSKKNQLTADSMTIAIVDNVPDSLVMYSSAFIVMQDTTETFNQIKGRNMIGHFSGSELKNIDVDGNAQTVFYLRDEDDYLIGINRAESSTMSIRLLNGELKSISYNEDAKETTYPPEKFPAEGKKLKGFNWFEDFRPKDKMDIYRKD